MTPRKREPEFDEDADDEDELIVDEDDAEESADYSEYDDQPRLPPDVEADDDVPRFGPGGTPTTLKRPSLAEWMNAAQPFVDNYPEDYWLNLHRDAPARYPDGETEARGLAWGRIHHVFDEAWIQQNFGGYRYHVALIGPKTSGRKTIRQVYLSQYGGIRIAGDPLPPEESEARLKRRPYTPVSKEQAQRASEPAKPAPMDPREQYIFEKARRSDEMLEAAAAEAASRQTTRQAIRESDDPNVQFIMGMFEKLETKYAEERREMRETIRELQHKSQRDPRAAADDRLFGLVERTLERPTEPQRVDNSAETKRLHEHIKELQDQIKELSRDHRTELDTLAKRHSDELREVRADAREASDRREQALRQQYDDRASAVRQQNEDLIASLKRNADDRAEAFKAQIDDMRQQLAETKKRLADTEDELRKTTMDSYANKSQYEIVKSISETKEALLKREKKTDDVGGLAGLAKTVREVKEASELIGGGAAAAAAPTSRLDKLLDFGLAAAEKGKLGEVMDAIAGGVRKRTEKKDQEKPKKEEKPAPDASKRENAQRSFENYQKTMRASEKQERRQVAQQQKYEAVEGSIDLKELDAMLDAEAGRHQGKTQPQQEKAKKLTADAAPQKEAAQPAAQEPAPSDDTEEAAGQILDGIEMAAATNLPHDQLTDQILDSFGVSREIALGMLGDANIEEALSMFGISRDRLSEPGAEYFAEVCQRIEEIQREFQENQET